MTAAPRTGTATPTAEPVPPGEATTERRLARLEAERSILRTFARFFRLVDTREHERVAARCLTPDATLDCHVPAFHRLRGHDEFTRHLLTVVAPRSQMVAHVPGLAVIDWDEDGQPSLSAYTTVWHWYTVNAHHGDLRPADWTTIGLVEDDYRLHDGRWLIAHRRVTPVAGLVAAGSPPPPAAAHDRPGA
ncbi:nuclear transport factor 2 family protein [Frankia sp. CNm7]|uniref:Nuclear transport factor 2 family protein n=1 Tax=Frankia nepalensis TaxID=1836974 RepID=A0A937RI62_9ACTN|nr:nuclear transport factor 2 family protein [Frankia nepalensis]MBL7498122.1 nuclear transport factor 2 family protein [Frankia nepalensis]MBL7509263.1 nuclear transport factor 2 family protein [Frankia nepalensis]MBL7522752.1 nuclear transport factor 2 family protein [Frankia nepalensis]MBL7630800.1 nuclear transport factor 2 family protein [Frankia nepalensis]